MPVTVCATLSAPEAMDTNLLYCPAMALAWRALTERFGPLQMEPQPPLADALNAESLDENIVDPAWCVARAGFGAEGILQAIRAELAEKLPDAKPEALPAFVAPNALFAYSYLSKELRFRTPFATQDAYFKREFVQGLGVLSDDEDPDRERARRSQVLIHDHISNTEFVLELLAEDSESRILIAQIPPRETLAATVRDALDRLGRVYGEWRFLGSDEVLCIPQLAFRSETRFSELAGRPLRNAMIEGRSFDNASLEVVFRLDEAGARVIAQALMPSMGPAEVKKVRSFCVTKPFLVMLLRRASTTPFLALWVETHEWMQVLEREPLLPAVRHYPLPSREEMMRLWTFTPPEGEPGSGEPHR